MQKVYVNEEEKVKIMDNLSRDIEVRINMFLKLFLLTNRHAVSPLCDGVRLLVVSCANEDHGL